MTVTLFAVGCADGGLPTVPVNGVVTFAGGPPPAKGSVIFSPVDVAEGLPRRAGTGKFDVDGSFVVTSFQDGDGLVPGTYDVNVTCYTGLPNESLPDPFSEIDKVPKDWRPEQLTVSVESGAVEVAYDVPPKK